jgi:hypothetical protein
MTTFLAWVAVDSRGASSAYLASDSRISWGPGRVWDRGRKVFASVRTPDLLGYAGDVLVPSLMLAQLTSCMDSGTLFPPDSSPSERLSIIVAHIKDTLALFQETTAFSILYVTRHLDKMESSFHAFRIDCNKKRECQLTALPIPSSSGVIHAFGSGEAGFKKWNARWRSSSQGGTSRAIFSALCDSLANKEDPSSGGAPQLVGTYRIGPGRPIGVIHSGRPWLLGLPIDPSVATTAPVEWRNRLFEECDTTGVRLPRAQRHHAPRGLATDGA